MAVVAAWVGGVGMYELAHNLPELLTLWGLCGVGSACSRAKEG